MRTRQILGALVLVLTAAPSHGQTIDTTCRFTQFVNHVLAPVDLAFGIPPTGVTARVSIDPEAGSFALDGGSIQIPPYRMAFSEARDTLDFADEVFVGTIDAAGEVIIPGVRLVICTLGTPEGTDCVPSNLCEDDKTTICIKAAGAGRGCTPGVRCRGVCARDRRQSCDRDADCAAGDRCGDGTLTPFNITLGTGTQSFKDQTKDGARLDFASGAMLLTSLGSTPRESPIIQDSGVTSMEISCTLDAVPEPVELPRAAALSVQSAKVDFGSGAPGAPDDSFTLKAVFVPRAGTSPDPGTEPLQIEIGGELGVCDGNSENVGVACNADNECILNDISPVREAKCLRRQKTLLALSIPAGRLVGNAKGSLFKIADRGGTCAADTHSPGAACVADVDCQGTCERVRAIVPATAAGAAPTHTITVKRSKKGKMKVSLRSTGLDLDGMNIQTLTGGSGAKRVDLTARLRVGALQSASSVESAKGSSKGLKF
jgi:hypothetical protein